MGVFFQVKKEKLLPEKSFSIRFRLDPAPSTSYPHRS